MVRLIHYSERDRQLACPPLGVLTYPRGQNKTLSQHVLDALQAADKPLTPLELREQLNKAGCPVRKQSLAICLRGMRWRGLIVTRPASNRDGTTARHPTYLPAVATRRSQP